MKKENKRKRAYGGYSDEELINVAEAMSDELMSLYNTGSKSDATHVAAHLKQAWAECDARGIHPADPKGAGYGWTATVTRCTENTPAKS